MPRRTILSDAELASLLALPGTEAELIRRYTFSDADLAIIAQHRGPANRLGFAIQLCYMRYPGIALAADHAPAASLLRLAAAQLKLPPEHWAAYGKREQTRREHLVELQTVFGFRLFGKRHYRSAVHNLEELAWQTDKGVVLAAALVDELRRQAVLLPTLPVIERICAEAVTRGNRRIYRALNEPLINAHRRRLDNLLERREASKKTQLQWLRQSPGRPNSRHMLEHIERLKYLQTVDLPEGIGRSLHQNRLLKLAREGDQMRAAELVKFEPLRRYATLVALVVEGVATVTDEIIDLHDRILGRIFNSAKQRHQQQFQEAGKAINDKVRLYSKIGRALLEARQSGMDAFAAIESVIPWEVFVASVTEAQKLAPSDDFDYLPRVVDSHAMVRRYAPAFLAALDFSAAPAAQDVLDAVGALSVMYASNYRLLPADVPTAFIKKRWEKLVFTVGGIDVRFYEICALSELRNALRSGDIWVRGSRQFKNFEEYLLPPPSFAVLRRSGPWPLAVVPDCAEYLRERMELLSQKLETTDALAAANDLPDAIVTTSGLKITPLDAAVPEAAQTLIDQCAGLLPHVKITELLQEVDAWTNFTRHFAHLKSGEEVKDKTLLLTAVLADAVNLGLSKMAESCPGTTHAKLSWLQAWYIRDETYSAALAALVNAQFRQPFAAHWGEGVTSSSDGQRFKTASRAESTGHVNPKYGAEPGRMFYTHVSD